MFEKFHLVDLTHPLDETVPTWSGGCGFCLEIKKDYDKTFRVQQIKMHAGIGTHIDAPSHRFQGGLSVHDIPLDTLMVRAVKIDVSNAPPDYEISVEDLKKYENDFGSIPEKSLVIGFTGWDRLFSKNDAYRNVDKNGQMHFPAFSEKSAEYLLKKNVAGLAIDTLSPDCLNLEYPVHKLFLGEGKYIIENIANASKMVPQGSFVIALPLNAKNASEAPIRIVGLIPK